MKGTDRRTARLRRFAVLLLVTAACGGSSTRRTTTYEDVSAGAADELPPSEAERVRAEEPEAPYEHVRRRAFRPSERCGQGPYRIPIEAVGARYSEQLLVHACAPRQIRGSYRMVYADESRNGQPQAWGRWQENAACVASGHERASVGGVSSGGGGEAAGERRGGSAPTVAESAEAVTLDEIDASALEECPAGTFRVPLQHYTWHGSPRTSLRAGERIAVEFWSSAPNDFEGVVFVAVQRAIDDAMTDERWAEYLRAHDEWLERYRAALDVDVASGRTTIIDTTAESQRPPPPRDEARPPRPSVNATWVAGYWHFEERWSWIPGFWRVPERDIEAELTVRAPAPPPAAPPREETRDPKPARTAVWAEGHWQWDGARYVWVAGAWRIPPSARHRWQPSTWRIDARGAVFVPGGFRVRLR